jgi:thiol-disulfide isomerase/thioredoxin
MKALGVLLLFIGLAVLGVFLWPVLNPQAGSDATAAPEATTYRRARVVARAATSAPLPKDDGKTVAATRAAAEAPTKESAPSGPFCDRLLSAKEGPRISLPKGAALPGLPASTGEAHKGWRWINLWAAWCKPCKHEMPILQSWATELNAKGDRAPQIVYLSLDDDERQLKRYLNGEGKPFADKVLWVQDESARSAFFKATGLENPPTLPVQILVDPKSRLRCVRVGSVTRADLDEVSRTFGW